MKYGICSETLKSPRVNLGGFATLHRPSVSPSLSPISKASSGNYLRNDVETYINWVYSQYFLLPLLTKIYTDPSPSPICTFFHDCSLQTTWDALTVNSITGCMKPGGPWDLSQNIHSVLIHSIHLQSLRKPKQAAEALLGVCKNPYPSLQLQDGTTKSFVICRNYPWHRHTHNVSIYHCPLLCNSITQRYF